MPTWRGRERTAGDLISRETAELNRRYRVVKRGQYGELVTELQYRIQSTGSIMPPVDFTRIKTIILVIQHSLMTHPLRCFLIKLLILLMSPNYSRRAILISGTLRQHQPNVETQESAEIPHSNLKIIPISLC